MANTVSVDKLLKELSDIDARRSEVVKTIQAALQSLGNSVQFASPAAGTERPRTGRRPGFKMSAEAKARIAAAQRKRWAKVRKAAANA